MSSRNYHIDDRLDGASLAQALKQLLRDRSWGEVKRLIATRHVQVHGNLTLDEGRRLKSGDVVKVWDEPLNKPPEPADIPIVYRDEHLIIVEKPAGVTTQREAREISSGRNQKQATLDELLDRALATLPRPAAMSVAHAPVAKPPRAGDFVLKRRPTPPLKPAGPSHAPRIKVRPVHRLDRDTSGLMVFALSPEAEQKLVGLFKHHDIGRVYRAVVLGRMASPMTIESDFVRDRGDGVRGSTSDPKAPDAQHAITHVKPIGHIGNAYTIVECRLETGRTHQIRIHLAERGHMLCGEKTYVKPTAGGKPVKDESGAPRHALHSAEINFAHPITGQRLHYRSDWPRDLARWIERLRAG